MLKNSKITDTKVHKTVQLVSQLVSLNSICIKLDFVTITSIPNIW